MDNVFLSILLSRYILCRKCLILSKLQRGVTRLNRLIIGVGSHEGASIKGHRESVALLQDQVHHRFGLWLGFHHTLRCITYKKNKQTHDEQGIAVKAIFLCLTLQLHTQKSDN